MPPPRTYPSIEHSLLGGGAVLMLLTPGSAQFPRGCCYRYPDVEETLLRELNISNVLQAIDLQGFTELLYQIIMVYRSVQQSILGNPI